MELDKPLNQSLQSGSKKISYMSSNRPLKNYYGALEVNLKTCVKGKKMEGLQYGHTILKFLKGKSGSRPP